MKILVQAKNMKVTQGIQSFVNDKVVGTIGKLGEKVMAVKIFVENIARKKNDTTASEAKVQIQVPGKDIIVEQKSHDLYQAIGDAVEAGARQLRKSKEKRYTKIKRNRKSPSQF
jgi:ribosomal subunit interface protein